jgi:hypothetical protein
VDGRAPVDLVRFSPELDEKLAKLIAGDHSPSRWSLEYCGAQERLALELWVRPERPLRLELVTVFDGLPGAALVPRGPLSYPSWGSDVTEVALSLTL